MKVKDNNKTLSSLCHPNVYNGCFLTKYILENTNLVLFYASWEIFSNLYNNCYDYSNSTLFLVIHQRVNQDLKMGQVHPRESFVTDTLRVTVVLQF